MKLNNLIWIWALLFFQISCNGASESNIESPPINPPRNGTSLPPLAGPNVMPLTVNGSLCSNSYINKPCVSITLCDPNNSSDCQTINDIIVDTGSSGLRVFKSAINPSLSSKFVPVEVSGNSIAECAQFGDGSSQWGQVQKAQLVLGNEPPVLTNIHVIDSTYANSQEHCFGAEESPTEAGLNGILGVGFFAQDCGDLCTTQIKNENYYSCNATTCAETTLALENQVQNPIILLPNDNNGIILSLSAIAPNGQLFANGYLILGIGTQTNNIPSGVTPFPTDPKLGYLISNIEGKDYISFIDSGSNGLFFSPPTGISLPSCESQDPDLGNWFCPPSTVNLSSLISGVQGTPTSSVPFQIGNFAYLIRSPNNVFQEVGSDAPVGSNLLIWGMPFFYGRNVYFGFEGKSSSLGTGAYIAY